MKNTSKSKETTDKSSSWKNLEDVTFIWKQPIGVDSVNGDKEEKQTRIQVLGERLQEIEKKHGYLKADLVVEDARDESSPLHKHFEWNDGVAAEKFRLGQARQLISTVYIQPPAGADVKQPVRAWVNVLKTEDGDRRYENIATAMSDEMKRKRLLNQALAELKRVQTRYAGLEELSQVFEAVAALQAVA